MDFGTIMKLRSAWDKFQKGHPRFPAFLAAARSRDYKEGTVIAVSITEPDGRKIETNVKLTAEDAELIQELKNVHP